MTSRRIVVSAAATIALTSTWRPARAQVLKVPDPMELRVVMKDVARAELIVRATDALRTLLSQTEPALRNQQAFDLWRTGSDRMGASRALLTSGEAQAVVQKNLDDKKLVDEVRASTQQTIASAKKMEAALKQGGLSPDSPLSNFLFRSFFQFDQFIVLRTQNKQRWYCDIYPFSLFCS